MEATRVIRFYESAEDYRVLSDGGYTLNVAKKVVGTSGRSSNVIWKTLPLTPRLEVSWKAKYALCWTVQCPTEGDAFSVLGTWQPCDFGESYDLSEDGLWQPSIIVGDQTHLNVGEVLFKYPDHSGGIHIVIGIMDAITKRYEAIYVDQAGILPGGSAKYQPNGNLDFWYEAKTSNDSLSSSAQTSVGHVDTSVRGATGKHEWWITLVTGTGRWEVSSTAPRTC
ncbi:hypothetical protein OC845_006103 [Tilletia horrida]|nr:hypothetical protein OC845_006103 [Tilletia horrida]